MHLCLSVSHREKLFSNLRGNVLQEKMSTQYLLQRVGKELWNILFLGVLEQCCLAIYLYQVSENFVERIV